jgi:lipopolysaccharide/colanic/teichoic acid biosynthesis glycosyltransferase
LEDIPVAQREYQRKLIVCSEAWKKIRFGAVFPKSRAEILRAESARTNWQGPGRELHLASPLVRRSPATVARHLRRAFDVICAAAGLALLVPLFAMIALAIRLDDGGPVLYAYPRVGKALRPFRFLKFRTMKCSAAGGSPVTAPHDARVTRVGRVLRKYKLDELPQLVNVLKGDMRFVGARPQLEWHVALFRNEYAELLQSPPGITDLATLTFRHEERFFREGSIEEQYVNKIMPMKLQLALNYSRTRTLLSDLEIIFRTILGMDAPSTAWRGVSMDALPKSFSEHFFRNAL